MAFVDPTDSVIAALTNDGREIMARIGIGELSYQFTGYKVGRGGYPNANPVKVDPINPVLTDLLDPVFPITTGALQPFSTIEKPYPNVTALVCRLDRFQALYGLGEIGIWVTIRMSTIAALDSGTTVAVDDEVLYGVAHHPMKGKTSNDVFLSRLIISY